MSDDKESNDFSEADRKQAVLVLSSFIAISKKALSEGMKPINLYRVALSFYIIEAMATKVSPDTIINNVFHMMEEQGYLEDFETEKHFPDLDAADAILEAKSKIKFTN